MYFISYGTPGIAQKSFLFLSIRIPGAVPALFCNGLDIRGTIAWLILFCAIGIFLLLKMLLTSLRIFLLVMSGDLKNFEIHNFVISSCVGPNPPVTKITSYFL